MKKIIGIFFIFLTCISFAQETKKDTSVSIKDFIEKEAVTFYWDSLSSLGTLEKNGHTLSFSLDSEFIILDGQKLGVTQAPFIQNGILYVSENFTQQAQNLFKTVVEEVNHFKIGAIFIDAGHGGKDPGTVDTHTVNNILSFT